MASDATARASRRTRPRSQTSSTSPGRVAAKSAPSKVTASPRAPDASHGPFHVGTAPLAPTATGNTATPPRDGAQPAIASATAKTPDGREARTTGA